ncbi:WGR domain-containing protein, predicted DNA-binding domain in MolR [Rhizobiales bacterium GAS188]|nr:WGR domain-containing protein, predicted DNA-binding domain in MolR [Rhizobiales bacterium GAS188]
MHIADAGTDQPLQLLVLERRDYARNMARWYVLSIEPTLFGDQALIREWGRTGSAGRRLGNPYSSKAAAAEALEAWLARKLRRGYRIRAMEDEGGLRQAKYSRQRVRYVGD